MSGGSYDYIYTRVRVAATEIRSRMERNGRVDALVKVRLWEPASRAALEYHGEEARQICAQIDAHRLWLADLLELVAQALHDVEWVDSADYGLGDEIAAIRALMRPDVSAIEGISWPPPPPTPEPAPAPGASLVGAAVSGYDLDDLGEILWLGGLGRTPTVEEVRSRLDHLLRGRPSEGDRVHIDSLLSELRASKEGS